MKYNIINVMFVPVLALADEYVVLLQASEVSMECHYNTKR